MTPNDKIEALSRSSLGEELDATERQVLADRVGVQTLQDQEVLVAEGEARRTLFVLASGRISVRSTQRSPETTVHEMREGECAGTRAFVDGSKRRATLRAQGPSEVLTLEPDDFEALIETHPRLVYKVMRGIFRVTHHNLMRKNYESGQVEEYFLRTGGRH